MRKLTLLLVAGAVALSGCDVIGQVTMDKLAVGTVIATPEIDRPDGTKVQDPVVVADVFYGERQPGVLPSTPPTGIPGATVKEVIFDDIANKLTNVALDDQQDGTYTADSVASPELSPYQPQAEYRTEIEDDKPTPYVLTASQAPAAEAPGGVPQTQPSGVDLDVTRTGTDTAFLSVLELTASGPTETWSNRPKTPVDLLTLIADPTAWQAASFKIPGQQAFPEAGDYVVVLTTVTRAVPDASLFATSGVFVGASSAVPLTVQ